DHIDRSNGPPIGSLALGEVLDTSQPIPIASGLLESLVSGGLLHLAFELTLDRLGVSREKLDHLVDDRPVVLLRDVADAGGETAIDVVIEARDTGVASGLRPLAGAVREDTVEHVQRLAHLLRVRVRTEVDDPPAVPLPGEHHARVLVLDRDRDVRKRLVVAKPDVERRPVPLDEILLEVERLDLVLGDDDLDVLDPLG